jgi:hypothetical protein
MWAVRILEDCEDRLGHGFERTAELAPAEKGEKAGRLTLG